MAPHNASETDLYEILGVLPEANLVEIKKAYRKKALTCHPDKNPDNPAAAKQWEELSNALQILTDSEARAAYDKVLKAKKATELRNRGLESKRRKVKEDLEAREAAYKEQLRQSSQDAAQKLAQVIKKLQEEGSRVLAEEQRLLKEQIKTGSNQTQDNDDPPRLKVKWKSNKTDETNGGYNYDILYKALQKYGPISNLLVSSRKNGSAVVELGTSRAAELAVKNEMGLSSNPLQLSWLSGQPTQSRVAQGSTDSLTQQSANTTETDFESLVLERMKSAQQQQKTSDVRSNTDETRMSQDGSNSNTAECNSHESQWTTKTKTTLSEESSPSVCSPMSSEQMEKNPGQSNGRFTTSSSTGGEAKDYESLVLMRMRQAQERQRLIEQMAREDAQDS